MNVLGGCSGGILLANFKEVVMRRFLVLGVLAVGSGAFGFVMGQEKADSGLPVYLVAQIQIDDRETYRKYEAGFGEIFQK